MTGTLGQVRITQYGSHDKKACVVISPPVRKKLNTSFFPELKMEVPKE